MTSQIIYPVILGILLLCHQVSTVGECCPCIKLVDIAECAKTSAGSAALTAYVSIAAAAKAAYSWASDAVSWICGFPRRKPGMIDWQDTGAVEIFKREVGSDKESFEEVFNSCEELYGVRSMERRECCLCPYELRLWN